MTEEQSIAREKLLLDPDKLWATVMERSDRARKCGALRSIPTECEFVEQGGVRFLVRILANLARKDAARKQQDKQTTSSNREFNPFLPYEEDLFVANISDTHVCILNKFNVVENHLLIVTRAFEEQENLLTLQDFEAVWACLTESDGLVFYNGGKTAGASQRHKHLQIVPLPFLPSEPQIPIEALMESLLASTELQESVITIPSLPFIHAFARLDPLWAQSPLKAAEVTSDRYRSLLRAVGLEDGNGVSGARQSGAYNLLATRRWMFLVPRSQESFKSISVNSLGFAGALLVRNERKMEILKDCGPMTLLEKVAIPKASSV